MTARAEPPAPDAENAGTMAGQDADRSDVVAGVDERPHRRREWSGGLRSVVLPLLAVIAIVGAVWYLQDGRGRGVEREQGIGIVALPEGMNPTDKPPAVEVGRAAPDFVLRTMDGGTVRLSDLRGRPVLVNFWASWCQPCRSEMPEIVQASAGPEGPGFAVVAVDLQEAEGPVRDFAQQFGMSFPVAFDRTGEVARTFRADKELPTTVFVDRTGVVREIKQGPMTAAYLAGQLAALEG